MSKATPIRRILLALGGTPFSESAAQCAVELAVRYQASITAVPVLDVNSWKQMFGGYVSVHQVARAVEQQPWRQAERRLEQIVSRFRERCDEQQTSCQVVEADPDDPLATVIDRWRYHDLLVFGLRGLFDYWIVPDAGAAIGRLVQAGVRPIVAPPAESAKVRRVLVIYDGSMASARALKRFVKLNPWPDAAVTLCGLAIDDPSAEALLADAADYCREHGVEAETRVGESGSANGILKTAKQCAAEAIVIGDSFQQAGLFDLTGSGMTDLIRRSDRLLFISH